MKPVRTVKTDEPSIVAAVETLSSIADLELATVLQDPLLTAPLPSEGAVVEKTVRWLHQKNAEYMKALLCEKFSVLLKRFKMSYEGEEDQESIEGIRTIMELADEAAEKVDRYAEVFLGSQVEKVKTSKEFRELCDFYRKNVPSSSVSSKKISKTEALPVPEILTRTGVQNQPWAKQTVLTPLSLELEDLKQDVDSELLFLRKADGSRFFTPKLIRNMTLACDIERAVDWSGEAERPREIQRLCRLEASGGIKHILDQSYRSMDNFFHHAHRSFAHSAMAHMYSPCIALMEASIQAVHQPDVPRVKGVVEYEHDFRDLLSSEVHLGESKRLFTYPPVHERSWESSLLRLSEQLAFSLVVGAPLTAEFIESYRGFVQQKMIEGERQLGGADGTQSKWWALHYASLKALVGSAWNTRLLKILEELHEKPRFQYEPLIDGCLSHHLCDLMWKERMIPVIQLPSPTHQERIDVAVPSDSFQIAVRKAVRDCGNVLIINLQDRTGWRDGARCQAIEGLQSDDTIGKHIAVLTLAKDGEWYHQDGSFANLSSATLFKKEFVKQILGERYKAPRGVAFSEQDYATLIDAIHTSIYSGRNILTKVMRCECIDLVDICMVLQTIERVRPGMLFITCKDGLDITLTTFGSLFSFLKLLNQRDFSKEDRDWLDAVVCGLPLIERERLPFSDRFHRMVSLVRLIELATGNGEMVEDRRMIRAIREFLPGGISGAAMLPAVYTQIR